MFEKGGSNADSSSPRGLSPADSVNSGERPARKVRTSFVAVEPSGRVDIGAGGDKVEGSGTLNGTDGSAQKVDPVGNVAVNGKGEQKVVDSKDGTRAKEDSGTLQNVNGGKTKPPGADGEKAQSMATDANPAQNNPKFKAELDQIVAKSAVNGTGGQERSNGWSGSKTDSRVQPRSNAENTKVESKSPMSKSKDISGKSSRVNGNNPNNNGNAIKKTNGTNHDNNESEKSTKSPLSTPRRSKAANTMINGNSVLSPRNVALLKSPNSVKSATKSGQGMQDSPTKTKDASVANAKSRVSSSGAAAKLPGSSAEKPSVKSPSTATTYTSTARKDIPSTRKSTATVASSQKLANSKEKRTSLPSANGNASKLSSLKGSSWASIGPNAMTIEKKSDSSGNPAAQPLKSPRRSGPLSAHLTAPTASSTAKHNSQSSQSSQSQSQSFASSTSALVRKPSTMARERTAGTAKSTAATSLPSARQAPNAKNTASTSTTNPKRHQSRVSLPSTLSKDNTNKSASSKVTASSSTTTATTNRGSELSHSGDGRSSGKSFLDRMMRPTASFASKTHEKVDVKSPPPQRSASVRTRQKPTLGDTGRNAGSKGTAGDGSNKGPVSRTRALQDALIGSKGRKQGAGASTGPAAGAAGSRKGNSGSGSGSGPIAKKEALKGKEGVSKGHANDHAESTNKEKDTEQVLSVPKQEEQEEHDEVTSTKEEAITPNEDADVDNNKQTSPAEVNVKTDGEEKEEQSDETPKVEPISERKPERKDEEAKTGGQTEEKEENHINGDSIDDGTAIVNNNGDVDGKHDEDGENKDISKNVDKPVTEQDGVHDTIISSDGLGDPFVVETPKFDRTIIR